MNSKRPLCLLTSFACSALVQGAEQRTDVMVTARVLGSAHIESQSLPTELTIGPADLQRGYLDIADPATLQITSNSPSGFMLDVQPVAPLASGIRISGMSSGGAGEVALGADGGTLVRRWQHGQTLALTLHVRLTLAEGIRPGRYPWPLRFEVRPLDAAAPVAR